jgi:hypothetical protein
MTVTLVVLASLMTLVTSGVLVALQLSRDADQAALRLRGRPSTTPPRAFEPPR